MGISGKVEGRKLINLFNMLVENKMIISMAVVRAEFERLTCVTDVTWANGTGYFTIDLPRGFRSVTRFIKPLKLSFNFNGPDNLEYMFGTVGGQYNGNRFILKIPEHVDRLQRRRDFRIPARMNTKMIFESENLKAMMEIINISLSGAYGVMEAHNLEDVKGAVLKTGQNIHNAGLIFPADDEMKKRAVVIRKADVRRVERDMERHCYKYAIKFLDIDKNHYDRLTTIIYHLQRQQLKCE
ncbi:MAG: PilZ domain-containing protein [Desulfobacteraceae bacterium]|nr:PilZ domain-containing protein [Desulfobacteraceae bacterium]